MICSICKKEGHIKTNQTFHPKKEKDIEDIEDDDIEDEDIEELTEKIDKIGLVEINKEKKDMIELVGPKVEFLEIVKENILSVNSWKHTKSFKSIKDKETQFSYYKRKGSCEEVLSLVNLDSKPFGSESEKILQEIFKLGSRTSTQNDGTRKGKKIEIKSARYWAGKDDCMWQHLEPDHDYEFAMFALLDFDGWKVWMIKKEILMGEMRDKKIVTFQGKQGWWVKKSAILPYLKIITTIDDLDCYIES